METMTNPLNERALKERINYRLRQRGEVLFRTRSADAEQRLGKYFVVNTERKEITGNAVDLEGVGRSLGVLREWEELSE